MGTQWGEVVQYFLLFLSSSSSSLSSSFFFFFFFFLLLLLHSPSSSPSFSFFFFIYCYCCFLPHPKGTYADDCIVERVHQHKCYIVATCDRDLKRRIRKVPGVPIMYITNHKSVFFFWNERHKKLINNK